MQVKYLSAAAKIAREGPDTVGPEGAKEFIAQHKPTIVDVRPAAQYESRLRAEGAVSAPLSELVEADGVHPALPADLAAPLLLI